MHAIIFMMDSEPDLQEIYRLVKENNKMLHAMRRAAWMHSLFKLLLYGVAIAVMLWFYIHYVAPLMLQMLDTLNKIQGASSQAQGQLSEWTSQLDKIRQFIPGASSTSTH